MSEETKKTAEAPEQEVKETEAAPQEAPETAAAPEKEAEQNPQTPRRKMAGSTRRHARWTP